MKTPITYNNQLQVFTQNQNSVIAECAEITFINNGTSDILLNNSLIITPTQAISFDGKQFEKDVTYYQVYFSASTGNRCVVVRKYYNAYPMDSNAIG